MESIPEYYFVSLINSTMFSYYVDSFVNNTQTFQINDARQLPIIIPNEKTLDEIKEIFDGAIQTKRDFFNNTLPLEEAENKLNFLQEKLDKIVLNIYEI